jgi:hypothetical protein
MRTKFFALIGVPLALCWYVSTLKPPPLGPSPHWSKLATNVVLTSTIFAPPLFRR